MNNESILLEFEDLDLEKIPVSQVRDSKETVQLKNLSRRLSEGYEEAWEQIYLSLSDPLVDFLNQILHSTDDSFDVAQEIFISLWQNHDKIDPDKNIKGYLYAMAKGFAYNFLRDKKKESGFTSLSEMVEPSILDFAPDDMIIAEEAKELIHMALETMPKQRKRIFEMSRFEGLSNDEIATKLNITKRTVVNQITSTLKELRELLACALFFLM